MEAQTQFLELQTIGRQAKETEPILGILKEEQKNQILMEAANLLIQETEQILAANEKDMKNGQAKGMKEGLLDRLKLTPERIQGMAEGLRQIAKLPDPIGEIMSERTPSNGLEIRQVRVPLGVIGIIYESRPNVTADAFGLCFKTGNAVVLRGGSDAIFSNQAIVETLQNALTKHGVPAEAIQLLTDTSRETASAFMKLNQYIDVLIPRGSASLIATVVNNSTIPVIETGSGNCHIYVDEEADLNMAVEIVFNAKTQRIGVCNACESLVVHEKIKDSFLPLLRDKLSEKQVELRGDSSAAEVVPMKQATEEDWGREYLDYILSVKTVSSIEEAIAHINHYNTGHSEAIVTENSEHAEQFLREIDAAAVYVNASTRFTDGFEFGFGAEIGISTQKLHARGPMGLEALTSYKYKIYGNGQVRG
ncbi:MAG: glutamate-5-semialdehyde dehydrogenase [Lachnospiraceae bacterium]|nr:glutamate-5-semialdehyde dehydrogenase [Lachnospiraceae bacterium]